MKILSFFHKVFFAVNGKFSFTRFYSSLVAVAGTVWTLAQSGVIHLTKNETTGLLIFLFVAGKMTADALRAAISKPAAAPTPPIAAPVVPDAPQK